MADLEELFSRLKTQQQSSRQNGAAGSRVGDIWENKTPSTAMPTSQATETPTRHIMPRGATGETMSNNLLTLLNINRPQSNAAPQRAASAMPSQSIGKNPFEAAPPARQPSESAAFPPRFTADMQSSAALEPPANTQKFLLDLLTKPAKATETAQPLSKTPDLMKADQGMIEKLAQSFSNRPQQQSATTSTQPALAQKPTTPQVEAPQPGKAGRFNYVSPFDMLHASSPLNVPPPTQRPQPGEDKTPTSVAQKLEEIGEQVGKDVDQALAQAEESKGVGKEEDVNSNWSTAEEEDAKREEDDKVEAFNFPMKPFVMLQLQAGHVARSFRNSTWTNATPVARLKKEFSHDDRTLATASQRHILYTVVPTERKPASGLKVIRQDDGKNKHIWSASNERLCNVQMSPTGNDVLLATGINGNIFYTELPSAEGSVFDETDVESQGFIMTPPPNSDEPTTGTFATSSAIRTRAKLSNRDPSSCFAVARGRQIHLILPDIVKRPAYTDTRTRRVDTDKLLSHASFSINTGKASKDFCFSEDDTILASLDKIGNVKFWDIRALTADIGGFLAKPSKTELKEPVFHFSAGATSLKLEEKMSPCSILFVDKERAYGKTAALRYLLIGYQQNHLLQLWDLGLGKCVQELRFPESSETTDDGSAKGMCSITYHPKTAIICVGHPGRNSIYFLHLSAPKYSLAPMDQASYLSHISKGDKKNVPRPDNTAIMSGIREFSCSRVGHLRSLDILKTPYTTMDTQTQATDDEVLFELYLMHSKGVLGIQIARPDLGWDAKSRLIKPADAVERGVVVVHALTIPVIANEKTSTLGSILSRPATKPKKEDKTAPATPKAVDSPVVQPPVLTRDKSAALSTPRASSPVKATPPAAKSRPRVTSPAPTSRPTVTSPAPTVQPTITSPVSTPRPRVTSPAATHQPTVTSPSATPQPTVTSPAATPGHAESVAATTQQSPVIVTENGLGSQASNINQSIITPESYKMTYPQRASSSNSASEESIATETNGKTDKALSTTFSDQFDMLYSKLDSDRRIAEATGAAKQDAMLRLISSTLADNVEASLHKIVSSSIEQQVLPALTSQILANVERSVSQGVQKLLPAVVQQQVKTSIPEAVQAGLSKALQEATFVRAVATEAAKQLDGKIKASIQVEFQQFQATILAKLEAQHAESKIFSTGYAEHARSTNAKLEDSDEKTLKALQDSEQRITQLLSTMQAEQTRLADRVDSMQQPSTPDSSQTVQITQEEASEVQYLTQLLNDGNFEQATIQWLQSDQQAQLFDDLFVRINPAYLQHVSPLIALSVGATVTASFDSNVVKRLEWLSAVLDNMDINDAEIHDVVPKIMDVLIQRLQGAYMQIAETQPTNQEVLRKLASLNRQIGDIRKSLP